MISTHQKLSRKVGHRKLLIKNLLTSLFLYEKITSTNTKIKAVKPLAEKILSRVKTSDNNITLVRYLRKYLIGTNVIKKLIEVYQPNLINNDKFLFRYKLNSRKGDGADLSMLVVNPEIVKVIEATDEKKSDIKKLKSKNIKSIVK